MKLYGRILAKFPERSISRHQPCRIQAFRAGRLIWSGWQETEGQALDVFCRFARSQNYTMLRVARDVTGEVRARLELSAVSDGLNDSWCPRVPVCGVPGAFACPLSPWFEKKKNIHRPFSKGVAR